MRTSMSSNHRSTCEAHWLSSLDGNVPRGHRHQHRTYRLITATHEDFKGVHLLQCCYLLKHTQCRLLHGQQLVCAPQINSVKLSPQLIACSHS